MRTAKSLEGPFGTKTIQRFWSKIIKTKNCWEWAASKKKHGYGQFFVNKKHTQAHRFSFVLHVRDLKAGEVVLHICDNTSCVNPKHLRAGSQRENNQDCIDKGRARKSVGNKHWTRLNPANLATGDKNGARKYPDRLSRGEDHWTKKYPGKAKGHAVRGEKHGMCKFTDKQIEQIKEAEGTYTSIAKRFGCSIAYVSLLKRGLKR